MSVEETFGKIVKSKDDEHKDDESDIDDRIVIVPSMTYVNNLESKIHILESKIDFYEKIVADLARQVTSLMNDRGRDSTPVQTPTIKKKKPNVICGNK